MNQIQRRVYKEIKDINNNLDRVITDYCLDPLMEYYSNLGKEQVEVLNTNLINIQQVCSEIYSFLDSYTDNELIENLHKLDFLSSVLIDLSKVKYDVFTKIKYDALEEETIFNRFFREHCIDYLAKIRILSDISLKHGDRKTYNLTRGYLRSILTKMSSITLVAMEESFFCYVEILNKLEVEICDTLLKVREEILRRVTFEEREEEKEKIKLNNIYSVRDMDIYLLSDGYEVVGQTGSHKMYSKEGKKIPVPQHSKGLGKGLSRKIQKQSKGII